MYYLCSEYKGADQLTAQLIWVFVVAYAKSRFSHDAAHVNERRHNLDILLSKGGSFKRTFVSVCSTIQLLINCLSVEASYCVPLKFVIFIPPANCVCGGVYCFHVVRMSVQSTVCP